MCKHYKKQGVNLKNNPLSTRYGFIANLLISKVVVVQMYIQKQDNYGQWKTELSHINL